MATISIADNDARIQYTQAVTGNSTQLTIDYPFFALDDIKVIRTTSAGADTNLTRGTGSNTFAVVGTAVDDGYSGGYITLHDTNDNTFTYTIYRDTPIARTTDFATSGPFNIASLNTELDKIYAVMQQVENANDRALTLPDSDASTSITLPTLASRKGKYLAFNSTSGAAEIGGNVADTGTVATIAGNITTVAGISSNVTTVAGISSNVTTVAGISSNVTSVAGAITNINLLAASDVIADMALLGNADVIADMALLATSDVISDMNTLAVSDVISDLNTLATSDIVSDINTLATSDIVSDLNTLATSDIVSDLNTLATSDIVSDINILATSDIVSDLNSLATSDFVSDLNAIEAIKADVTTVADNVAGVNSFAERYRVASSDPSSSLNAGDLAFNTSSNVLKYYNGSSWQTISAISTGISSGDALVATSGIADNDFLRVDGTSIEGRSSSEIASDIGAATQDDATALAIALG